MGSQIIFDYYPLPYTQIVSLEYESHIESMTTDLGTPKILCHGGGARHLKIRAFSDDLEATVALANYVRQMQLQQKPIFVYSFPEYDVLWDDYFYVSISGEITAAGANLDIDLLAAYV